MDNVSFQAQRIINNKFTTNQHKTHLSRVDTRSIARVALECLKGVEVAGGAGCAGVPLVVNILLGNLVPKLVVIFAVFEVEFGGDAGAGGWDECGGGGHDGDGYDFGQLWSFEWTVWLGCEM